MSSTRYLLPTLTLIVLVWELCFGAFFGEANAGSDFDLERDATVELLSADVDGATEVMWAGVGAVVRQLPDIRVQVESVGEGLKLTIPGGSEYFSMEVQHVENAVFRFQAKLNGVVVESAFGRDVTVVDGYWYFDASDAGDERRIQLSLAEELLGSGPHVLELSALEVIPNSLLLRAHALDGGRVEASVDGIVQEIGSTIELRAVPDDAEGVRFLRWGGSLDSDDMVETVRLELGGVYLAYFAKEFEHGGQRYVATGQFLPERVEKLEEGSTRLVIQPRWSRYGTSGAVAEIRSPEAASGEVLKVWGRSTAEQGSQVANEYFHSTGWSSQDIGPEGLEFDFFEGNAALLVVGYHVGDGEIELVFRKRYYPLAVERIGDGGVLLNPEKERYEAGEVVELLADPASGSDFMGWSGDVVGMETERSLVMDGAKMVEARFDWSIIEDGGGFRVVDQARRDLSWWIDSRDGIARKLQWNPEKGAQRRLVTLELEGPGRLRFKYHGGGHEDAFPRLNEQKLSLERSAEEYGVWSLDRDEHGVWELQLNDGSYRLQLMGVGDAGYVSDPTAQAVTIASEMSFEVGYALDVDYQNRDNPNFRSWFPMVSPNQRLFASGAKVTVRNESSDQWHRFNRWTGDLDLTGVRNEIEMNRNLRIRASYSLKTSDFGFARIDGEAMHLYQSDLSNLGLRAFGAKDREVSGAMQVGLGESRFLRVSLEALVEGENDWVELAFYVDGREAFARMYRESQRDQFRLELRQDASILSWKYTIRGGFSEIRLRQVSLDTTTRDVRPKIASHFIEVTSKFNDIANGDIVEYRLSPDAPDEASLLVPCEEDRARLLDFKPGAYPVKSVRYLVNRNSDRPCILDSITAAGSFVDRFSPFLHMKEVENPEGGIATYRIGSSEKEVGGIIDLSYLTPCVVRFQFKPDEDRQWLMQVGPGYNHAWPEVFHSYSVVGNGGWYDVSIFVPSEESHIDINSIYPGVALVRDFQVNAGYGVSYISDQSGELNFFPAKRSYLSDEYIGLQIVCPSGYFLPGEVPMDSLAEPLVYRSVVDASKGTRLDLRFEPLRSIEEGKARYRYRGRYPAEEGDLNLDSVALAKGVSELSIEVEGPGALTFSGLSYRLFEDGQLVSDSSNGYGSEHVLVGPGTHRYAIDSMSEGYVDKVRFAEGYSVSFYGNLEEMNDPRWVDVSPSRTGLNLGDRVSIRPRSAENRRFERWLDARASSGPELEIVIDGHQLIGAEFSTRVSNDGLHVTRLYDSARGMYVHRFALEEPAVVFGACEQVVVDGVARSELIIGTAGAMLPDEAKTVEVWSIHPHLDIRDGYGVFEDPEGARIQIEEYSPYGWIRANLPASYSARDLPVLRMKGMNHDAASAARDREWYGSCPTTTPVLEFQLAGHALVGLKPLPQEELVFQGRTYTVEAGEADVVAGGTGLGFGWPERLEKLRMQSADAGLSVWLDHGIYRLSGNVQARIGSAVYDGGDFRNSVIFVRKDGARAYLSGLGPLLGLEATSIDELIASDEWWRWGDEDSDGIENWAEVYMGSDPFANENWLGIGIEKGRNRIALEVVLFAGEDPANGRIEYWEYNDWVRAWVTKETPLGVSRWTREAGPVFDTYTIPLELDKARSTLYRFKREAPW